MILKSHGVRSHNEGIVEAEHNALLPRICFQSVEGTQELERRVMHSSPLRAVDLRNQVLPTFGSATGYLCLFVKESKIFEYPK